MKFLSKATMPVTLEIDDDGTIATKSYVDAAVASVGGGFEDLGIFNSDHEIITYIITNDLGSGMYTLTYNNYSGTVCLLALVRFAAGIYGGTFINGDTFYAVEIDDPNSIFEIYNYKYEIEAIKENNSDRISNLEDQLSGLEALLGGI